MDATAMVDGGLVRNKDERPIRFKIWAPHRKIAIERLPKGVASSVERTVWDGVTARPTEAPKKAVPRLQSRRPLLQKPRTSRPS